ncbi:threonine ammonia-lyase [Polycladidibacter hongkongensis]|uniref:threonine ammonia-lyase n=1 Tax=Polycladidibacter hongkongensis TaxID=1647556 RepID=UPI0008317886|nr:threonine/serine dehydratase [Pseudovibrio hongkongensis]
MADNKEQEHVSYQDIVEAEQRIRPEARVTPLLCSEVLDRISGRRVFLKPETLQRTGSFKFRGAYNRLQLIPEGERSAGVVACSSGNHAQGVAAAAGLLGMQATIVMPQDAPATKIERTKALGAEVVLYDRDQQDRDQIAKDLCAKRGATLVHPYEDTGIVAGQGTAGLEMVTQMRAQGVVPDAVLCCTGGGGLSSGVAIGVEHGFANTVLVTCEPEGFDDYARSLAKGERVANKRFGGSVCDAVLTPTPGKISFDILKDRRVASVVVSDEEALRAVAFAFTELKLVVEPGGAVALAAVLFDRLPAEMRSVAVVLSGGNVDADVMAKALSLPPIA